MSQEQSNNNTVPSTTPSTQHPAPPPAVITHSPSVFLNTYTASASPLTPSIYLPPPYNNPAFNISSTDPVPNEGLPRLDEPLFFWILESHAVIEQVRMRIDQEGIRNGDEMTRKYVNALSEIAGEIRVEGFVVSRMILGDGAFMLTFNKV